MNATKQERLEGLHFEIDLVLDTLMGLYDSDEYKSFIEDETKGLFHHAEHNLELFKDHLGGMIKR